MILMYHNIDEKRGANTVSVENFIEQVKYVKNSGKFKILNLDDYIVNLSDCKIQNPISFSFDDAYVSLTKYVLSVIKEYDVPISVFIPTFWTGKQNAWDLDKGYPEIKILNWNELKELSTEKLITIGSHGVNHLSHGNLSEAEDLNEFISSKEQIYENIGIKVKYYSFPFGQQKDISKYSKNNLLKSGYSAALSTNWSRKNTNRYIFALNRIEILGTDDISTFINKLESTPDFKSYKQKLKNILFKTKLLR